MSAVNVYRKILRTRDEFCEFLQSSGRPRFAITDVDGECEFLAQGEWVFSDDLHLLMHNLLEWDKRNCGLHYQEAHGVYDGSWSVVGLPDYFNDVAMMMDFTPVNAHGECVDARNVFFDLVWKHSYTCGFFTLPVESFDDYLSDWDTVQ